MAPEVETLGEVDHAMLVIGILRMVLANHIKDLSMDKTYPFSQLLENVDFDQSLLVKALFVANDFDGF